MIKMRSRPGEFETHHEQHSYYSILESYRERGCAGADLIEIGYGPLEKFLVPGSALVTVSSTAALESIDRGIPTLLVSDFGFRPELLNEVFADSGATGTLAEVVTGSIGFPSAPWLERNYFQPVSTDLRRRLGLLAARARAGQLPNRRFRGVETEARARPRRAAHPRAGVDHSRVSQAPSVSQGSSLTPCVRAQSRRPSGDSLRFFHLNDLGVRAGVLEHPGAVGIEAKDHRQTDADDVRRDVVGELIAHVEQIPGRSQRDDRDDHAGDVHGDEQQHASQVASR